jgi:hypothetical protein
VDDQLVVLGINAWNEPEGAVADFVGENKLKHRILLDGAEVAERYGLEGLPAIVWVDREGMIVDAALGLTRSKRIHDKTEALLRLSQE